MGLEFPLESVIEFFLIHFLPQYARNSLSATTTTKKKKKRVKERKEETKSNLYM